MEKQLRLQDTAIGPYIGLLNRKDMIGRISVTCVLKCKLVFRLEVR